MPDIGRILQGLSSGAEAGLGTYLGLIERQRAEEEREREADREAGERNERRIERQRERAEEWEARQRQEQQQRNLAKLYAQRRPDLFPSPQAALSAIQGGAQVSLLEKPEEEERYIQVGGRRFEDSPPGEAKALAWQRSLGEAGRRPDEPDAPDPREQRFADEDAVFGILATGADPQSLATLRASMGDARFLAAIRGIGQSEINQLRIPGPSGWGLTTGEIIEMSQPRAPASQGPDPGNPGDFSGLLSRAQRSLRGIL